MDAGYNTPLYLLPFDHRQSYVADMFDFTVPLTAAEKATVADSKQLIYEGFLAAIDEMIPPSCTGILVDEEYGANILHDARERGFATALSVEKSGSNEFLFEYGEDFRQHIDAFRPTFAKVLVRYNPAGDPAVNVRQIARLRQLSLYCHRVGQHFMFELLVPATAMQMAFVHGNKDAYDAKLRPSLMRQAVRSLQNNGVEPDVWKIEGLSNHDDCEHLVDIVRRDGRSNVGCIVLGRGADVGRVSEWLETAASVEGFVGFAVGRTTFWDAVADFKSHKCTREEAVSRIAQLFRQWVGIFEKVRTSRVRGSYEQAHANMKAAAG